MKILRCKKKCASGLWRVIQDGNYLYVQRREGYRLWATYTAASADETTGKMLLQDYLQYEAEELERLKQSNTEVSEDGRVA